MREMNWKELENLLMVFFCCWAYSLAYEYPIESSEYGGKAKGVTEPGQLTSNDNSTALSLRARIGIGVGSVVGAILLTLCWVCILTYICYKCCKWYRHRKLRRSTDVASETSNLVYSDGATDPEYYRRSGSAASSRLSDFADLRPGDSQSEGDVTSKPTQKSRKKGYGSRSVEGLPLLQEARASLIHNGAQSKAKTEAIDTVNADGAKPSKPLKQKELVAQRKEDSNAEKVNARKAVVYVAELTRAYNPKDIEPLPEIGSRLQKFWFKAYLTTDVPNILSIAPIPRHCPLLRDDTIDEKMIKALRELMRIFKVHPFLQPVEYIHHVPDRRQMIIVQPLMKHGSLKDLIHEGKKSKKLKDDHYCKSWSEKYQEDSKHSKGLSTDNVFLFGRQILEAMNFLYTKLKVTFLDTVHSGNVLVAEENNVLRVRLGGYENTLLGYRSRFYRMCKDHLEHMDVIMFGHLVFEMSCGYELTTLAPTKKDYKAVTVKELKQVLQFIFIADEFPNFDDVITHQCFHSQLVEKVDPKKFKLTKDVKTEVRQRVLDYQANAFSEQREERSQAADKYLQRTHPDKQKLELPQLGTHVTTSWFELTADHRSLLLCVTAIPVHCQLGDKKAKGRMTIEHKTLKTLNDTFQQLQKHPCIHPVVEVHCESEHLIVIQPFEPLGSLKDIIYGTSEKIRRKPWQGKYANSGKGLPVDKIAHYGKHILQAMMFLYEKGFPVLGVVKSGNIFVDQDDVCRLGGYENTLLGYRSRFYRMCKDHLEHMDVIMFGHLVFEMSCGYELTTLAPTEKDYKAVKDERVKGILHFIFTEGFPNHIANVASHEFFASISLPWLDDFDSNKITLNRSMKNMLKSAHDDHASLINSIKDTADQKQASF